jgi:hypothetical protein
LPQSGASIPGVLRQEPELNHISARGGPNFMLHPKVQLGLQVGLLLGLHSRTINFFA